MNLSLDQGTIAFSGVVHVIGRICDLVDYVIGCRNGPGQEKDHQAAQQDPVRTGRRQKIPVQEKKGCGSDKDRDAARPAAQSHGAKICIHLMLLPGIDLVGVTQSQFYRNPAPKRSHSRIF